MLEDSTSIEEMIRIDGDVLIPLSNGNNNGNERRYGFLGISGVSDRIPFEPEVMEALSRLKERAAIALRDRQMLEQVLKSSKNLIHRNR